MNRRKFLISGGGLFASLSLSSQIAQSSNISTIHNSSSGNILSLTKNGNESHYFCGDAVEVTNNGETTVYEVPDRISGVRTQQEKSVKDNRIYYMWNDSELSFEEPNGLAYWDMEEKTHEIIYEQETGLTTSLGPVVSNTNIIYWNHVEDTTYNAYDIDTSQHIETIEVNSADHADLYQTDIIVVDGDNDGPYRLIRATENAELVWDVELEIQSGSDAGLVGVYVYDDIAYVRQWEYITAYNVEDGSLLWIDGDTPGSGDIFHIYNQIALMGDGYKSFDSETGEVINDYTEENENSGTITQVNTDSVEYLDLGEHLQWSPEEDIFDTGIYRSEDKLITNHLQGTDEETINIGTDKD